VHNVVVLVEDDPPAGDPGLLGVYDGVSLTERGADHSGLPDRITIFRRPLQDLCLDTEELVREVRITVVHEIAHHFGIDDARLHELGYG
jgi:predicted Zn-dependent protease with MMP-like domain